MYFDNAIGFESFSPAHVGTLAFFFPLAFAPPSTVTPNACIGVTTIDFLVRFISADGVRLNADTVAILNEMPMPVDPEQHRSLLGSLSYYRMFLPQMARRIRPIMALLKKGVPFEFIAETKLSFSACLPALHRLRCWSSPIGTPSMMAPSRFAFTVTTLRMAPVPS